MAARSSSIFEVDDAPSAPTKVIPTGTLRANGIVTVPVPFGSAPRGTAPRFISFHPDRADPTIFASPHGETELPSDLDVEDYEEDMRSLTRGMAPPEAQVEEFAGTIRRPIVAGQLEYDVDGRLWVARSRDRIERSYFDIFEDDEFLGTASVPGRLYGFDIIGSRLVVLAEHPTEDRSRSRRLDWYEIEG